MTRWVVLAAVVVGCGGETECDGVPAPTGTIIRGPTSTVITDELLVRGTATHPGGLAIRTVTVAGIPAEKESFNYGGWSALIPAEILVRIADEAGTETTTVEVAATDACDQTALLGSFGVRASETGAAVTSLTMTLRIPSEHNYLPADGSLSALVDVEANPEAAGATVAVSASHGEFEGLDDGEATLIGDGSTPAATTLVYHPGGPGSVVLTAAAGTKTATAAVSVVGAPRIVPAGATLTPGQSIVVQVETDGVVAACDATGDGLSATSGDVNLAVQPGGEDTNGDGTVDVTVTADAPDESVTIVCTDVYGQAASAVFESQ